MPNRFADNLPRLFNKSYKLNGKAFAPDTPLSPPGGPLRSWVHYGVMVPDLPAPHYMFNVMSVVGTPGATVFDNDFAMKESPQDTAYLISTTASMTPGQFRSYSISRECEFRSDGSLLRFGNDLEIKGAYPRWQVRRRSEDLEIVLDIEASSTVSHFAHIPKLYDHWSLLCRYSGTLHQGDSTETVTGLCTFEYAAGAGLYSLGQSRMPARGKVPLTFFTYQILNVSDRKQVLLVELLGPGGFVVQRSVYVRSLDDYGQVYNRGVAFCVEAYEPEAATTPDGFRMRLPKRFTWHAQTDDGAPLLSLSCEVAGDYEFGLGAGYVNWYRYEGTLEGEAIRGNGYLEYIDRR